ncbi:LCP family protein [Congzhengia minquanensis]|uniref:LCP family protein n=1 Tax=Congzhengia minquanensis TaxID=2763657 RepID=A0A926DM46_9FIRM|nr:LCP family protein [Congzhengia minquanensis]MBC8541508.1 LCP family protein [Congzhengia minquanensis]
MNKRKFILSLVITLAVLAIIFVVFQLFSSNTGFQDALDSSGSGKINVLVVGVDKDGTRSDVNMLFSLDPKEKTVNLMSIPRDTRVEFKKGSHGKINACIGKQNGEELLIETVKDLTGMPIHNFCKVNFEGLRNIIDILGGVEFDVPMDMDYDDPAQDLHIHLKKGKQTLNGADAEGLLRFRKGYATGDLGRIDMQQAFLKELINQKLSPKYIFKAVPVVKEISKNVETDMSVMYMLKYAWKFRDSDKVEFNSYTLPGAPKMIGGVSYYLCDEAATENLVRTQFGYSDGESTSSGNNPINEKVID